MKRSRFTEEQIIAILREQEAGAKTADVCRKYGVSGATFYKWKAKFGGMGVAEAKRLIEPASRQFSVGPRDAALRVARTCYDHLAGQLGVTLADALVPAGYAELSADAGIITGAGNAFFHDIGIKVDRLMEEKPRRSKRVLCRPCGLPRIEPQTVRAGH